MNPSSLFTKIDCLRLYVPDLAQGIEFYHHRLGLPIEWKTETAVGFLLGDGVGELVIQNEMNVSETDLAVESVSEAVKTIEQAGGTVVHGPFEIAIGKCAVVKDPWDNELVILDTTKGTFVTDSEGNITGRKS